MTAPRHHVPPCGPWIPCRACADAEEYARTCETCGGSGHACAACIYDDMIAYHQAAVALQRRQIGLGCLERAVRRSHAGPCPADCPICAQLVYLDRETP